MGKVSATSTPEELMRERMEVRLDGRKERASRVKLQHLIPAHWFAAAASECASMYLDGHFYGTISVAQAYVEALTRYLADHHRLRVGKGVEARCTRLVQARVISTAAQQAVLAIMEHRNDFHHLNKEVPGEYQDLLGRAESCINSLHVIESEVFAYSIGPPGMVAPKHPEYWPQAGPDTVNVYLRNLL